MTAKKLAEKINRALITTSTDRVELIASIIDEAFLKARDEARIEQMQVDMDYKNKRVLSQIERDARIAEGPLPMPLDHVDCVIDTGKNIANMIRSQSKRQGEE